MIATTATDYPTRRRRGPRAEAPADFLDALRADQDASQLADDLAALVEAGLIAPTGEREELRFALVEARRSVSKRTPHGAGCQRAHAPARSAAACKTDEQGVG